MSEYSHLQEKLSELQAEKEKHIQRGSGLAKSIIIFLGLPLLICLLENFVFHTEYLMTIAVIVLLGGLLIFIPSTFFKIISRSKAKSINDQLEPLLDEISSLKKEREDLLSRIKNGDKSALSSFDKYAVQDTQTTFLPSKDAITLNFQEDEICYILMNEVQMGRLTRHTTEPKKVNLIDTGLLTFTNQRIVYLGNAKNFSVSKEHVLAYESFDDGLSITQEGRKTPDFFLGVDGVLLAAIIEGLIK